MVAVEPTDIERLAAWRSGDKAAGQALVAKYFDGVCRFFRSKLGDDVVDISDLVQQTFMDCVTSSSVVTKSYAAFLYTIARARLLDYLRSKYKRVAHSALSEMSLADLGAGACTVLARQEAQQALLAALHKLPVDTRILLELTYWENLSAPEIAAVLGIPANTVRGKLSRAREALRELMLVDETTLDQTLSEFA